MEAFTSMARSGTMKAIAASAKNKSLLSMKKQAFAEISWCPEPESNRYALLKAADFKSAVSTNFTIGAHLVRQTNLPP